MCKNKQVPEKKEIRRLLHLDFEKPANLSPVKLHVYCYQGIVGDGAFMDTNPGKTNKKERHHHLNSSHVYPSSRSLF